MAEVRVRTIVGWFLAVFELGWFALGLVYSPAHPAIGWIPLPLSGALAAYVCIRAGRRADLAVTTRRFWFRIGLGCVALVGGILSNAVDAFPGGPPSQRLSPQTVAIYMLTVAAGMWALLGLPGWRRDRGEWARFGLDAAIVLLTSGLLIWHFSLRGLPQATGSILPSIGIALVAMVSMVAFVKVALAGIGEVDRRALQLLAAGIAAASASGAVAFLILDKPYLSISFVACSIASLGAQLGAERQIAAPVRPVTAPPVRRRANLLPYVAALTMAGVLLTIEIPEGGEHLVVALCVLAVTALAGLRQLRALHDNNRLLDTVDTNLRELHETQNELAHQVSHDALTEIPNRTLFDEKVTAELASGEPFHVVLLDLDDFKVVNDRLGHGTGDALLRAVSRRLHERLRPSDTVARLGGDEFTLLLTGRTAEETADLLHEIVEGVQEPVHLNGLEMIARISAGLTRSQPGDTPEELLRRADVAMYAAKSVGGGRWTWFDPIMDRLADADARLGNDLRTALARDEMFVLYQPIVELPDGRLAGVEALVRWRHPELGMVSPAVFIPLAERNGTILELGWWVLEQVVRQAAYWEDRFGEDAPEKVSVNISARQLGEPGFSDRVATLLRDTGINPQRMVAEVTETAVLGTDEALDAVRRLHDLGMRVALDDFGTGQSSLSLLVDTPVRVLKVDKSFVDGVTASSPQAVIVDSLIGITDGLRIEAVAEGVETAEQAIRLHSVGYRYAQGFHFARPMPADDISSLLAPSLSEPYESRQSLPT